MRQAHIPFGVIAAFVIVIAITTTARADEWHTNGILYAQEANMDGHTTVNGQRTDVSVSFSELLDHLDLAGMMALRSETERSALTFNAQFVELSDDGSDFIWSTLLVADWSLSQNFGLVFGYRALDTDYSKGSGDERFEFDLRVSGPLLGLSFNFGT